MKHTGINRLNVEGKNSIGYGYSKFINLNVEGKKSTPLLVAKINPFGIKESWNVLEKQIYAKIEDKKDYLSFYAKTTNPETKGYLCGITNIVLGESVWGPQSNFNLGKVKDYSKILVNTEWEFNSKGPADLLYDVWLLDKKLDENHVEIMVLLDHNFEPPFEDFGEFKQFKVKYERKTKENHPYDSGHTFAFILKEKLDQTKFDLIELINYCKKRFRNMDNFLIKSIDLGIEFSKNTEVEAKVYGADLKMVGKLK